MSDLIQAAKKAIAANNFRCAALIAGTDEKIEYANDRFFEAMDALAKAVETANLPADRDLEAEAKRGRYLVEHGEWLRFDQDDDDSRASTFLAVRVAPSADLSCKPMREDAIDAGMKAKNFS